MLQSFISMAVITVVWVLVGFSLAFEDSQEVISNPSTYFLMKGVIGGTWKLAPTIAFSVCFYQLKFAIITRRW